MKTASVASLSLVSGLALAAPNCRDVKFTVTGTATNKNLTGIPTTPLSALSAFFESAPGVAVTGPQTIAGTYCAPLFPGPNNDKLEVLFGSITGSRAEWDALGNAPAGFPPYKPEQYSWTAFANKLGYPTLAIDRLGNGASSHPDPLVIVQAPYEIALYNNLAEQIRSGKTGQLPRSYNDLTYVGNSYGSQLGVGMADAHPDAYNRFLLTGFTDNFQQDFFGVGLTTPLPAAIVDPARFGTLDPGFVTTSSKPGRTNSFFGSKAQVNFEDTVADLFFQRKDVVSLGQFGSVYAIPFVAPKYTGRVLVLDGEQDQATCGPGSPVIGPASCGGQGQPKASKSVLPASDYSYKTVDKTGHAIQLCLSSQKVYTIAHQWIGGANFQGGPPA